MRVRKGKFFYDEVVKIKVDDVAQLEWWVKDDQKSYGCDSGLPPECAEEMRRQMSLILRTKDYVDLDQVFENVKKHFEEKDKTEKEEAEIEDHLEN